MVLCDAKMLKLVKLERKYYPLLVDMMDEWTESGERIIPYAVRKNDYKDYDSYFEGLDNPGSDTMVPDSTYFCLDEERNIFVGAVNIRHYLNESLLFRGGHIGDGVRPSERGKGIGTQMVALALEKCRELGIDRVLMVCSKSNVASAKTIINNGGILENEINVNSVIEQRYWIEL